jgi:hypothetical protein
VGTYSCCRPPARERFAYYSEIGDRLGERILLLRLKPGVLEAELGYSKAMIQGAIPPPSSELIIETFNVSC